MELRPARLLSRMYRQASGTNSPPAARCRGPLASLFDRRLYLFNVQGTAKAAKIIEVFDYAMRRYGCRHFLVDSLAKCGFGEDDYNGQKAFVDALMEFSLHNSVHVHIVAHSRKMTGEHEEPGKMDVKGTGALTDMVDNVFMVWRNKPKEEATQKSGVGFAGKHAGKPDCVVNCCKQRHGEWEGKIGLFFDRPSLQYVENEGDKAMEYDLNKNRGGE
jgi:twinkle protein